MNWMGQNWGDLLQTAGVVGALWYSGYGFYVNARVRRAETHLELTKQHRELQSYIRSFPESVDLRDPMRNLREKPRTETETYLVNLVLLHSHAVFQARKARIFIFPSRGLEDVSQFMSRPVPRDAWNELRSFHEQEFVDFIEKTLSH